MDIYAVILHFIIRNNPQLPLRECERLAKKDYEEWLNSINAQ